MVATALISDAIGTTYRDDYLWYIMIHFYYSPGRQELGEKQGRRQVFQTGGASY